ncbi:NAD(P)/FAD-dependent oxidoreductase [Rhodopila sp.]|uniref:NAD(P)/FAD-dependent oxidoreductase n=1 Tax=Rhodopila sp. TaxID=2480087 RepID=UPI003D11503E
MRQPLPPSLYADTARPPPETPPLDGDRRASVAIVGGGFTGLSAALHLAEHGTDVVVLEANEPGWGASGRNGGQVNPGLKHDPDRVEADFGRDLGSRMVALSGNAPNVVFDLIQRHQIACAALQSGTLRAAMHPRAGKNIRISAEQGMRRGMPVTLLDRAAVSHATGTDRYHSAMLDRRGGQVNPLGYARGLAQAAMQQGATVHGGTRVQRLHRDGGLWQVKTPTGILRADKLILATNGYTGDLWPGLRRSIVPVYSAIAATGPLPDSLARRIMPTRSVLYEIGNVTVYYRLDPDNRLLMGGRGMQRDIATPGQIQYLIDYAIRLWPALRGVKWTHGWNGQLAITPDHYPHIHEPADTVLACLGYNGRGVAMSSAMGPELARRALGGRAAEIAMPITGIKEMPFHALWRSAVAARVAYGRIRDSLGL